MSKCRKQIFVFITCFIAIITGIFVTPVQAHAQKLIHYVYLEGNYVGVDVRSVLSQKPYSFSDVRTPLDYNITSYINGLTVPLRIRYYPDNGPYNSEAQHMYPYVLYTVDNSGDNKLFYNAGFLNISVPTGVQATYAGTDHDQIKFLIMNYSNLGGDFNSSNFQLGANYTRTNVSVYKNINTNVSSSGPANVTAKWGTKTSLAKPTMKTFYVTYNLCDDATARASIASTNTGYQYESFGYSASIKGAARNDNVIDGVYATMSGLNFCSGGSWSGGNSSSYHAIDNSAVEYNYVYGDLTIPAIQRDSNPHISASDQTPYVNNASATFTAQYRRPVIYLSTPTRPGYQFEGWYTNPQYTGTRYTTSIPATGISTNPEYTAPARNFTLYAKWKPNEITCYYRVDSVVKETKKTFAHSNFTTASRNLISKPHYHTETLCWNMNNNKFRDNSSYAVNTYIPTWTQATSSVYFDAILETNKHNLVYNSNKPTKSKSNPVNPNGRVKNKTNFVCTSTYNLAQSYNLTGYNAIGWNSNKTAKVKQYSFGQSVNHIISPNNNTCVHGSTLTLYQIWEPITYYIDYHSNLDTDTVKTSTPYKYDEDYTAYTQPQTGFNKPGYYIAYWTTNPDGSGKKYWNDDGTIVDYGDVGTKYSSSDKEWSNTTGVNAKFTNLTTTHNAHVNLYAHWEPIKWYIIYNKNDALDGLAPNSTKADSYKELHYFDDPVDKFAKNLWIRYNTSGDSSFLGWNTEVVTESGNPLAYTAKWVDVDLVHNLTTIRDDSVSVYAIFDDLPTLSVKGTSMTYEQISNGLTGATTFDTYSGSPLEIALLDDGDPHDREDDCRAGRTRVPMGEYYRLKYLAPNTMRLNNVSTAYDIIWMVRDTKGHEITKQATLYQGNERSIMIK